MFLQIPFERNEMKLHTQPCTIEKVVEISADDFDNLKTHTMKDFEFIRNEAELMKTDKENNINRCVLFLKSGYDEGMIINSQGTSYAKNFSYLPKARTILRADESYVLTEQQKDMLRLRKEFLSDMLKGQEEGRYVIDLSEVKSIYEPKYLDIDLFIKMLEERREVGCIDLDEELLTIDISHDFIKQSDDNVYKRLDDDEITIKLARHILWIHGEYGGEQANFNGCHIKEYDFSNANLNSANLSGAKFSKCNFWESELCFAEINDSDFINCQMQRMYCDETIIKNTRIKNSNLWCSTFGHAFLKDVEFKSCGVHNTVFQNCCLDNTRFISTKVSEAQQNNCVCSYDDWIETSEELEDVQEMNV